MGWTAKRNKETGLQEDLEWVRQWLEISPNVKQYGAIGDGSHNDLGSFIEADRFALAAGLDSALIIKRGRYNITGDLTLQSVVIFEDGAQLVGSGTVSFNKQMYGRNEQHFAQTLTVSFSFQQIINAVWFGYNGIAITLALAAGVATFTHVRVPPLPAGGQWVSAGAIALPDKPVFIEGDIRKGNLGGGTELYFSSAGALNGIVLTNKCKLSGLRIIGNPAGTGHGLYSQAAGRVTVRDVYVDSFGGDGIHLETSYTNEFYNVEVLNSGNIGISLLNCNENRFYGCHSLRSGVNDVSIVGGEKNKLDVSISASGSTPTSDYAIVIGDESYGNEIWGFHDGGHRKIAQLSSLTRSNRIDMNAPAGSGYDDAGLYNSVRNSRDLLPEALNTVSSAITNEVRNSSFSANTNAWTKTGTVTITRITTEGGVSGTCCRCTFPRGIGSVGIVQSTLSNGTVVNGDRIRGRFMARLELGTLNAFDLPSVFLTPSVNLWPLGRQTFNLTSQWKTFEFEFIATGAQTITLGFDIFFDSSGIGDNIQMLITDVMYVKNPPRNHKLNFIQTGYAYPSIHFPVSSRVQSTFVRQLSVSDVVPTGPLPQETYLADGSIWDPLQKGGQAPYEAIYNQYSIRNAKYQWTISALGTAEYYLNVVAGEVPGIPQPSEVWAKGVQLTAGAVGALAAQQWAFADNDTLGYKTVYVRLTGDVDPDTYFIGDISARAYSDLAGNRTRRGVSSIADGGTISHGFTTTPQHAVAFATAAGHIAAVTAVSATALTISLINHDGTAVAVAENVRWEASLFYH